MADEKDGTGRLAVVTGASSGIGLHIAKELVANGFDVLVTAEDELVGEAADALLAGGTGVEVVRSDLTSHDGVADLVRAVEATGRPVDVLVLNAGVANGGPFLQTPLENDLEVIALNITAVVHLAKRLLPAMVDRGEGRVLVTASTAALIPGPYYATYAASKSFDLSFAEAIRYELKDTGVTVTALMPGPTDTNFFAASDMEETTVAQGPKDDPAKVAKDAYEGLMKGKDKVVVGSLKAKSQVAAAATLPTGAATAMHAAQTKPTDGGDG